MSCVTFSGYLSFLMFSVLICKMAGVGWEQPVLTPYTHLCGWLEKRCAIFLQRASRDRGVCVQPASSCLPRTMNVHDLTPREGPAYDIW